MYKFPPIAYSQQSSECNPLKTLDHITLSFKAFCVPLFLSKSLNCLPLHPSPASPGLSSLGLYLFLLSLHSFCSRMLASWLLLEHANHVPWVLCVLFPEPEMLFPDASWLFPHFIQDFASSPLRAVFLDPPLFKLQPTHTHPDHPALPRPSPSLLYFTSQHLYHVSISN